MKKVIGYLKNLAGTYYAKDMEGHLRELHPGDPVYEGEQVVDAAGHTLTDALRSSQHNSSSPEGTQESDTSAQTEGKETKPEGHEEAQPKSHIPETTEYRDPLETNYAESNIEAPLREAEFTREYTGFYRNGESDEVNIDAPLRRSLFDETEHPTDPFGEEGGVHHPPVILKLVALDADGNPILDAAGNYTSANGVIEANDASYMVVAFPPGTTTFSPGTRLDNQAGTVTISTLDQDAHGVVAQSRNDGSEDYEAAHGLSVPVGVPFKLETFDDYLREGTEHYQVMIDPESYSGEYPATVIEPTPVTTSIVDLGDGGGDDERTPKVTVDIEVDPGAEKLEGGSQYATTVDVKILDPDGNVVFERTGVAVDPATGQWSIDPSELPHFDEDTNYTAVAVSHDDQGADSVPAEDIDRYDQTPDPTVTVDIEVDPGAEKLEGDSANASTVDVVVTDPDGNVVFSRSDVPVDASGHWSIPQSDLPAFDEGKDYTATAIAKKQQGDQSVPAVDIDEYDPARTGNEPTVTVDIEVDPGAEKLEGTTTNATMVDVVIKDPDGNVIFSKSNVPVESDGSWHISPLELPQFDQATDYTAEAISKNNDGVESTPAADIDAYNLTPTVTVDLEVDPGMEKLEGTSTDATTVDVVIKDSDGNVIFSRDNIPVDSEGNWSVPASDLPDFEELKDYTAEAVAHDADGDESVPAADVDRYDTTHPVENPVYVQLYQDDTQPEGSDLVHHIRLVDENGNPVMLQDGQSITVTLNYTGVGEDPAESTDYIAQTTVVIQGAPGGNGEAVITVPSTDDFYAEGPEQYRISVADISDDNQTFEQVLDSGDTVVGTITDDEGTPNNLTDGPETDTSYDPDGDGTAHEPVTVKLVALDENGQPILDADGHYTFANAVYEEGAPKYMALAFAPGETVFSPDTKLDAQIGTVTIDFHDGTATGADSQTAEDGTQDYLDTTQTTVSLGTVISTETYDDYLADDGEQYAVTIREGSYAPDHGGYENVAIDTSPVTTTIHDDSNGDANQPDDPNTLDDDGAKESDHEQVVIKLVACDENGNPIVENGHYTVANEVIEGNDAHYMALAFKPGTTDFTTDARLDTQVGTINVSFLDRSPAEAVGHSGAQSAGDGTQDYDNTPQTSIRLGESFSTATLDDFRADDGERYEVAIDPASYARDNGNGYENVVIDPEHVTTTIHDNQPQTPIDPNTTPVEPGGYDPITDTVYVQLFDDDIQGEGAELTHHIKLVDAQGNDVMLDAGQSVTVTLNYNGYGSHPADGSDFIGQQTVTIQGAAGGNNVATITVPSIDDYYAEGAEQYEVSVDTVQDDNQLFETIADKGDTVIGTITDGAQDDVPNQPADTVYVQLFDDDIQGEGAELTHHIKLVDAQGNDVMLDAGQSVTVTLNYNGYGSHPADGSDFIGQQTVTIQGAAGGNNVATITVPSIDDYYAEGAEQYEVSVDTVQDDNQLFETIADKGDTVIGTITDGAQDDVPNQLADTVYVQLYTDASQVEAEGAELTHTLRLVDKDGNEVNLPTGETVTVNLAYSNDTTESADFQHPKVTQFVIQGDGGSTYTFSNTITQDTENEGIESYEVSVNSASTSYFENIQPDTNDPANSHYNHATGEIREEVAPNPDTATVVEGGNVIDNSTDQMNLLDNDETGINGKITSIQYIDENGATQTAQLSNGTVTVDTQFGQVTIHENGTWSFTSDPTEDNHPDAAEDVITYTVTDDDGKSGNATFTISVTDTDPSATAPNDQVDEENLSDGSNPNGSALTVTDNFNITKGADDIADVRFTDTNALQALGLTSDGTALSYALSSDGHTVTATAGGNNIFTIEILNPNDAAGTQQQYRFTLQGNLDHPDGNGENTIVLPFDFTVADTDSEVAGSQFTVTVVDDVPQANSEPVLSVVEGNVDLTGMIDLMDNDVTGADKPLSLQGFRYQGEDGQWHDGTFGQAEDTLYGTLTVNSNGTWSYTSDATEHNESGTDAQNTNDYVTDQFEYTVVDRDGDTSTATQDIQVTDGANPQINVTDGVVDEDNLGLGNTLTPTTITESLNITKGSDNIAETKLDIDATKTGLENLNLTSGGDALSYTVSDHTVTATAGGRTIFEMVLNHPTDGSGTQQSYSFTLYEPLDHVDNNQNDDNSTDDPMFLPFSIYTYDTDDSGTVNGDDDASDTFTVQVIDSVPSGTDQTVSTLEDHSVTFRLSIDDFQGDITIAAGNSPVAVAAGDSTDVYDAGGDDIIGSLKNNGDGTVTFTPNTDYSNYNTDPGKLPYFDYTVTDADGDEAQGRVVLKVDPVADRPDVTASDIQTLEDANAAQNQGNVREGGNEIGLGLTLPSKSGDQTDQNGNDSGDHPERLGYITLDFSNAADVAGAVVKAGGNSLTLDGTHDQIKVYISDVSNYHYAGLDPNAPGVWSLTQAEYEAMTITHAEDNDIDIDIDISVSSYEVDDADQPLDTSNAQYVETDTASMTVEIAARTDDISLAWDDNSRGTISTADNPNDTYTFNSISEGDADRTIDLTALLTATSGYANDAHGDLDGSEHRSYTITGIPNGTIVTIDGVSVAASGGTTDNSTDATATIDFPAGANQENDPSFTLTLPEQFGGKIENASITLSVKDVDTETGAEDVTKTAKVYFNIDITPVADPVTLQVAQPIGDEDAGRTHGNDRNDATADDIDAPENGIDLAIVASSDDDDGSETYNITVDQVPTGGSLYYNGVLFDPNHLPPANSGLTVTDNGDGTWKVEIDDFDNSAPFKFVPPHNSDDDYIFHISGISVEHNTDGSVATDGNGNVIQQLSPTELDVTVQVNDVADIPINDDLASTAVTDDEGDSNTFNAVGTEDAQNGIDLYDVLATPDTLSSYDQDGSETLTMKIYNLPEGFSIQGATQVGSSLWFVDLAALQNHQVKLVAPENYAGEVDFKLAMVTTENEGDSKTHPEKDVSVMITPEAEATINTHDTQNEDETITLDFSLNKPDTDGPEAGVESVHSFGIKVDSVPAGVVLKDSNGNELTDSDGDGYYEVAVNNGAVDAVTATLPEDSDMNGGYSFLVSYEIQDVAQDALGNTYTDIKTVTDATYTVSVAAVTDDIDMTTTTSATGSITADSGDAADVTVNGNGTFTKTISIAGIDSDGRGHPDYDGSEQFTRIKVTGVPQGVSVENGHYAGDTGGGNYSGVWYVDIPDITLDGNQSTYDLQFNVDYDLAQGDYNVTIIAFNEDHGNGSEQSDSETFTMHVPQNVDSGNTPPPPPEINAFYQDIDNDGTHDHDYTVSSSPDTNITDTDAYAGSILREDTPFTLDKVLHVDTTGSGDFSITIRNVSPGVVLSGNGLVFHDDGNGGFYTLSGSGDKSQIVNALSKITVTPVENANTDANDIQASDLNFDIELTTYTDPSDVQTAMINFTGSILPVTDPMDLTTVNDGTTDEDQRQTFSITMDNQADGVRTQIVDGKVYLKVNENYTDSNDGSDGTQGTLYDANGNVLTLTNVSGVAGIADGDYYVIENVDYGDTLTFSFQPAQDRSGSVDVDVYVKNIESENWTPYDTQELVSHQTVSFTVNPVVDGFGNASISATGDEDTLIRLDLSQLQDPDSSERLTSLTLDKIPNGFTVYYGDDEASAQIAQNIGVNGQMSMEMLYGQPEMVDYNLWNIPLQNGELPAYIAIKAPENWSGTIPDVTFSASGEGATQDIPFDVVVTPVVDSMTIEPTKTFGNEGEDIALKLNANVQDLDGSETVTLTLQGLGEGAAFKADGVGITASYDAGSDTYTLEHIAALDVNKLTVVQSAIQGTVTVTAKTVESDRSASAEVTGSFDINIHDSLPSNGDDILLYDGSSAIDGLDGEDTVVIKADVVSVDFSQLANIETIDLGAGDHNLGTLTLNDVVNMTDADNDLSIVGDNGDSVTLSGNWQAGANSNGLVEYTNSDDPTVLLKVDEDIQVTVA